MKNIKVGLIGSLDMLGFKNMKSQRDQIIEKHRPKEIVGEFSINKHAKEMHPDMQELVVKEVIEHFGGESKTYILESENNKVAYFRAGQTISLKLQIGNSFVTRPYSISSSPKENTYRITVKRKQNGFVSNYILDTFEVGTKVLASAPYGNFYYESFRDNKNVLAIAGGSGITPFVSMAYAIKDGIEDFNLTILYGNNVSNNILYKKELDKIQEICDKVKVIYVLANETKEGYEHGLIDASLIRKYAKEPYSIFISGPSAMHEFVNKEISILHKPRKDVRFETLACEGDISKSFIYPTDSIGKTYKIRVIQGPNTYTIDARADETVLVALERAGIKAPSKCRGGECGWCRSKLVVGNVFSNMKLDQRRYIDKEFNYIHPCSCYPIADCTIEVPAEYY